MWLLIPVEVILKHHFNSLTKLPKSIVPREPRRVRYNRAKRWFEKAGQPPSFPPPPSSSSSLQPLVGINLKPLLVPVWRNPPKKAPNRHLRDYVINLDSDQESNWDN